MKEMIENDTKKVFRNAENKLHLRGSNGANELEQEIATAYQKFKKDMGLQWREDDRYADFRAAYLEKKNPLSLSPEKYL